MSQDDKKKQYGPVPATSTVSGALERLSSSRSRRIEELARPGETWVQASARLREKEAKEAQASQSSIRKPPKGDVQPDFFIPTLYDVGTRDSRSIMDVAVFRLSKKSRRAGETIRYELPDGLVQVSAGPAGMASVWDYDLVLMAVSHLTEAMNRYREGKGDMPGRVFHPHLTDILKFCRRSDGGKQKDDLIEALLRLNTTHVAVERVKNGENGDTYKVFEGEPLISRYKVITNQRTGKPESVEIEIANWMYQEVTSGATPEVLTVHPDYFLIDPGVGRFVYRLGRRAAGKGEARWSFQKLYERSGSAGAFKEFCRILRRIIEANDLPEYDLREEAGVAGPLLVMTSRSASQAKPDCGGV